MSYLLYVALFGAVAVIFLWLRDARIYYRTGLPGYRKTARYGVLYGALATLGFLIALLGTFRRGAWHRHSDGRTFPSGQGNTGKGMERRKYRRTFLWLGPIREKIGIADGNGGRRMIQKPRGTRDFLPDEMERRRAIEKRMRDVARCWGYREVCTPEFEELELFTARSGEGIIEEMYVFRG